MSAQDWLNRLEAWANKTVEADRRKRTQRRDLTNADYDAFDAALDERAAAPMKPQTRQQLRALIRKRNPLRWWSLQNDLRWVEREMKALGYNPDDARYIL